MECSRCQKVVHATNVCSGLSGKQLAALKATENLEWNCSDCNLNCSRRKSAVTIEDIDEDDEDEALTPGPFDMKLIIQELRKEVRNIVTQEIRAVTTSLQYCSEKVDEFAESMDALTNKIKDMERKITFMDTQNRSCLLKIEFLEQRNMELEQQHLSDQIEISGIPDSNDMDLPALVDKVVTKLGVQKEEIFSVKRLPSRRTGSGPVHVKIRQESARQKIISAARDATICAKDLMPNLTGQPAEEKIRVREAITPYLKSLLWQAKQEMKGVFKFIWVKEGKVLVRKNENAKIYKLRSKNDIQNILSNTN